MRIAGGLEGQRLRPSKLILFDIDCTLMRTDGAGMRALRRALKSILGELQEDQVLPDGQTDPNIVRQLLHTQGVPENSWSDYERRILQEYPPLLAQELDRQRSRLEPGVAELLRHLSSESSFHLGVLTGNLEVTARLKLDLFDLNPTFPIGAFGSDHADRTQLGPVALARACRHYSSEYPLEHVWIVGDTPNDVAVAKALGGRSLAVATGSWSLAELESCQPDFCLQDLSQLERVLEIFHRA